MGINLSKLDYPSDYAKGEHSKSLREILHQGSLITSRPFTTALMRVLSGSHTVVSLDRAKVMAGYKQCDVITLLWFSFSRLHAPLRGGVLICRMRNPTFT